MDENDSPYAPSRSRPPSRSQSLSYDHNDTSPNRDRSPSNVNDRFSSREHHKEDHDPISPDRTTTSDVVRDQKDLEYGQSFDGKVEDPFLVSWNGPDDPLSPKNWSIRRKWAATIVISLYTFISPVSSSIAAPALASIGKDLHITSELQLELAFSIFVLAYAIGPLILGPLSETYGRSRVLQLGNLFYLAWNTGCGFAQTPGQLIAFRFLSGLGGSAPQAIGGGVLSDCWVAEDRGKAMSIYAMAPLLGPAVGPIAGGFIAQYSTWRWAFWSTSLLTVAVQIVGLFTLQETYPKTLLRRKAAKLRKESGDDRYHTEFDNDQKLITILRVAMIRPFRLLFTQPIIQIIAVYMAYLYGIMYLLLATFPGLWTGIYGESESIGGLNYISLGLGFAISTQISARFNDIIYRRLKKKNDGVGKPEMRIPMMIPSSFVVPIGLFWYGWSAQAHVHWILPNIGAFLFAASSIICFQCMQTYIVDSYTRYAASGVAAAVVLRALAGFGFPLFAPYMYSTLHYGWGNTLLALISIALGIPAPLLFWKYGAKLRERSPFAAG